MAIDITDVEHVRSTHITAPAADHIFVVVRDDADALPVQFNTNDTLEIRRLPAGGGPAVILASGVVPNSPAPRIWQAVITVAITQTPPN